MGFIVVLIGLLVIGVIGVAVVAGIIAMRNKQKFTDDAKLGPGLTTSAPSSWAGSHDPEARLHRRLRDAVAALAANQNFDFDGSLLDLRVELEQQAVALDEQLVSTAALAMHLREDPLSRISGAVASLEQAVADLAGASAAEAAQRLSVALSEISERTGMVAQARAELDAIDAKTVTPESPIPQGTPEAQGATDTPAEPTAPPRADGPGTEGTTGQAV